MTPDLPAGCVIAVLGAGGTGKTELAGALAARLACRGLAATLVPDLRAQWRLREGREPDAAALRALAREQARCIASAATHGIVVADTTTLLPAIECEHRFGDASLHENAIAAHRACAITLLMGLDLPCDRDEAARERTDTALRSALGRAGETYAVIHGRGAERLANAWNAIHARAEAAGTAPRDGDAAADRRTWFWPCDKCSDPVCEHRLFTHLVAARR